MIADSSVWIGHLRGSDHPAVAALRRALRQGLRILMPDLVLFEVLRGARDAVALLRLERELLRLPRLASRDGRLLVRQAAHLYARCRWAGFSPRSGADCLLAALVLESGVPLLHADRDFGRIAEVESGLRPLLMQP
jgi:predicted nucleic acid-binding protein